MHPKPNCIAAILISKLLLYSPFVFAAMGKRRLWKRQWNQPLQRGNKPLGRGIKPLPKGRTPLQRGSQPLQRGNLWKKGAVQKGILKKHNLQKLGQLSLQDKIKQIAETNDDEHEAAKELQKSMTTAEKSRTWSKHQTHLNKNGNEEERDALHLKMKRESWQPFSSWERKLPSSAMLAGPLAPSKR